MTEIVRHSTANQALSLAPMAPREAWVFAESLAGSNLLPGEYRNSPASVLWALEYGRALGLDVVTTITTIHVIKGKPTQSADLMLSRAREAGHRVRITTANDRCVVSIWRSDDAEFENRVEWTLDDAKRALLYPGKPDSNWAKYPRAMLRARAIAECVRSACPEVLHGAIYTPEELGARVDSDGVPQEADVAPLQPVRASYADPGVWAAVDPVPEAQTLATKGAAAADKVAWRQVWADAACASLLEATVTAPDSGEPDQLGAYLTRVGQGLPDAAADDASDVVVGQVVEDADDVAAARTEVMDAAAFLNIDAALVAAEFEKSFGHPMSEAPAAELRQMRDVLLDGAA